MCHDIKKTGDREGKTGRGDERGRGSSRTEGAPEKAAEKRYIRVAVRPTSIRGEPRLEDLATYKRERRSSGGKALEIGNF